MKYTNTMAAAFLIVGMTLFAGTAAAQPSNAQVETDAQASAQADTDLTEVVQKLQKQVQQLQERVAQLEKQVNASAEAEVDAEAERQGPPEQAQNRDNLGAEVSAEARAGDKKGIMGAISAFLGDRGNDRAAEAVQSDQGENSSEGDQNDRVEAQADAEARGQAEAESSETDTQAEAEAEADEGGLEAGAEAEGNLGLE